MDQPTLNKVIEDQLERSTQMLFAKNGGYNVAEDKLRNFKVAGTLQNENARQALAGMMAKHTVSVYDMGIASEINTDLDVWNEKITDHINYLLLLRAIVEEEVVEIASKNMSYPYPPRFDDEALASLREKLSGGVPVVEEGHKIVINEVDESANLDAIMNNSLPV